MFQANLEKKKHILR